MNKQIVKAPPKIHSLLRLQKYDFDLEYKKGQLMKVMDRLSRTALQDNTPEISNKEMNYFVYFVISSLTISEKTCQKLVTETGKDDTLQNYDIKSLQDDRIIASNSTPSQTIPSVLLNDHVPIWISSQGPTNHSALNTPTGNLQNPTPRPPGNWKNWPDNHSSG